MKKLLFLFSALIMSTMMWAGEKITTVAGITSSSKYYIGATTGGKDSYFYVDGSAKTESIKGVAKEDVADAVALTFTAVTDGWTIQFDNGLYLGIKNAKDNGAVQVKEDPVVWTIEEDADKGLLKLHPNDYYLQKNNSSTQFGSYKNIQTNVWLESAGAAPVLATLEGIVIKGEASKLEYIEGDSFNPIGLEVWGIYTKTVKGDSTSQITKGITWTIDPEVLAKEDNSVDVTAQYKDFTSEVFTVNSIVVKVKTYANTYASNVEFTAEGGTKATLSQVVVAEGDTVKAIKCGTSSVDGSCVITIPAATKTLHFHAVSWTGKPTTMDVNGTIYNLVADAGISGTSTTYTLAGEPSDYYFSFDPKGATAITFTAKSDHRFVLYGVNAESGTPVEKFDTLYLNTGGSSLWNKGDAKFAVWYWAEGVAGKFTNYLAPIEENADIYRVIIPQGMEKVIFVRMKNDAPATPAWGEGNANVWNQTNDLDIPANGDNCYTITGWGEGEGAPSVGTWSKYVPTPPCTPSFGLMVDETTYQEGTFNSTDSQWEVKGVSLTEGQSLTLYNKCAETAFMPKAGNFGEVFDADEAMTVQETAVYDFYIKLISGADELWVVKHVPEVLPQITEAPKSWAGEYVISYMKDVNNALVWTGIDAGQCRVETPVIDGKVTMVEPVKVIVEAMDGGGYSVKVKGGTNDGKYVTQKATPDYNSALNFVTTPVRVDIEMNDKGLVDFYQVINEEQKMYLLYNATSGASNERFRFYKGSNYSGSTYKSLTLFGTVAPVITYTDSVYYVAGNFTNWASEMKQLPYEVELPKDSVLEFKQIMLRTKLSDGDSIGQDTLWYGQENDGEYMTRESNTWMLNGGYNVLAKTDIAGSYTFSLNENGEFVMTWPKEPVITYKDSVYYVAGNFTNWAAGMQALPYEVELPKDSVLEFKQVLLRTILADGDSVGQDTTWFGQANEGNYMTRDNSAWALQENGYNVYATTDIAGTYAFALNENGEFVLTFPELCTPNFGLLVNGTTYYPGVENTEKGQWEVLSVKLNAGDMLQVKDTCSGEVWVPANIDHTEYFGNGGGLKDGGVYSFYLKLSLGNDELYIVKESSTGLDYMFEAKSNPYKTFREGNLFIIVGENVYTTQGVRVK